MKTCLKPSSTHIPTNSSSTAYMWSLHPDQSLLPPKFAHVDEGLMVRLTIREFLHSKEVLAIIVPLHLLEYVQFPTEYGSPCPLVASLAPLYRVALAKDTSVFVFNASVQACNALDIWLSLGLLHEPRALSGRLVERCRFSPRVGIGPPSSTFVSISGVASTCTYALRNSSSNLRSSSEPGGSWVEA